METNCNVYSKLTLFPQHFNHNTILGDVPHEMYYFLTLYNEIFP